MAVVCVCNGQEQLALRRQKAHMSRLACVATMCLIMSALLIAHVSASAETRAVDERFQLAAENQHLMLYVDPQTAEVVVQQRATGLIWSTNPLDRGSVEKIARGSAMNELQAQLVLHYYTPEDVAKTIDTYAESIAHEQFAIVSIENGIRIEYELGKRWDDWSHIPVMISQTRFDELLDRVEDDSAREFLRSQFYLISIEPYEGLGAWVDIAAFDFAKLFGHSQVVSDDVPLTTAADKRGISNHIVNSVHENRADYDRADQVQPEDLAAVRKQPTYIRRSPLRPWDIPKIADILKDIGYYPDERANDDLEYCLDPPEPNQVMFGAAIEYVLDCEDLVVRVPAADLTYPTDIPDDTGRLVSYRLHSVDVLPYFGAAGPSEVGHIFVPDGSGAIIYLNNGKIDRQPYQQPVYGLDRSLSLRTERRGFDELVRLPVYGLATQSRGHLAVIEEGGSLARIRADVAGRTNSYNFVSARFNVLPTARAVVYANEYGTADFLNVYQARSYQRNIVIRFSFLSGFDANYAGMARRYQRYLVDRYGLSRVGESQGLAMYLEVISAIHRERPVFGIPLKVIEPLSTFAQTREMVDWLLARGISDLRVRLSGWLSGGLEHDYPAGVKVEKVVGSINEFAALSDHLEASGVPLFADVGFLNVPKRAKGFNVRRNAARLLTREIAQVYWLDWATNFYEPGGDRFSYVLSPASLSGLIDQFLQDFSALGMSGISLRYMGEQINSDFRPDPQELVDRAEAQRIIVESAKKISAEWDVMITGGFDYLLPYTHHILNVPMHSSGYSILDEDVPFYQMVLRGYVDYTGEPMNLAQDRDASILRTVETGASLYCIGFYADSSAVKHTDFDHYYACGFSGLADHMVSVYDEINQLVGSTAGELIVDHAVLAPGVHMTMFESGIRVVVNYGEKAFESGDLRVEARGYTILEEQDWHGN